VFTTRTAIQRTNVRLGVSMGHGKQA
jgi:hypothetical protein